MPFLQGKFPYDLCGICAAGQIPESGTPFEGNDDPVGKIALDVGFGSGNYFTTEFGKLYHTTPQKYRKGQDT